jgi:hypothetical protein
VNLNGYSAGETYDDDTDDMKAVQDLSEDSIFNFNNWAASSPPLYQPHTGFPRFWHKGRLFWFSVNKGRVPGGFMGMMVQNEERIVLTMIGRSAEPIKALILETQDQRLAHQGRSAWNKVAMRHSRPTGTVALDDTRGAVVLNDINGFLHPRTPRWYANRGIPFRRGYSFHGPPRTGEASLSFALEGVFGLDVYCLSLSEATLTEEDLITQFNNLPRRCVILLEDIDSARRQRQSVASLEVRLGCRPCYSRNERRREKMLPFRGLTAPLTESCLGPCFSLQHLRSLGCSCTSLAEIYGSKYVRLLDTIHKLRGVIQQTCLTWLLNWTLIFQLPNAALRKGTYKRILGSWHMCIATLLFSVPSISASDSSSREQADAQNHISDLVAETIAILTRWSAPTLLASGAVFVIHRMTLLSGRRQRSETVKTARAAAGASCLVAGMLADPRSTAEWVFPTFSAAMLLQFLF